MKLRGADEPVEVKHADVSFEVRVERRERSFSCGEPRVRFFADSALTTDKVFNWSSGSVATELIQKALSADDESAIRRLIESYERLQPDQVESSLGDLTTSPYINVNNGVVTSVDAQKIRDWQKSAEYKRVIEHFNPEQAAPDVQLEHFSIWSTDTNTASVQYRTKETLADGSVHEGSSASIVVKGQEGKWRIAAQSEHPLTGK